jgi:hypothetical protein
MKKIEFDMAVRGLSEPVKTKAYPLIYLCRGRVWRFALHKHVRDWFVSDPISGARVCRVTASYKGVPVASRDLTIKQAMQAALVDIDAVVARVGFERFAATLDNPNPK